MAEITKVSGGVGTAGALQHFGGTGWQAYAVVVKNGSGETVDMSTEGGVGEAWEQIVQALEVLGTVVAMQYESDTSGQASFVIEQTGAGWTDATMQTALQALGASVGANTVDVSGTTVTGESLGLKLALS